MSRASAVRPAAGKGRLTAAGARGECAAQAGTRQEKAQSFHAAASGTRGAWRTRLSLNVHTTPSSTRAGESQTRHKTHASAPSAPQRPSAGSCVAREEEGPTRKETSPPSPLLSSVRGWKERM